MHTRSRPVQLKLPIPAADYRVFVGTSRILRRIMGHKAPTALGLIQHTLTGRDARGLADEYLDTVGWPLQGNRTVSLRRRHEVRLTVQRVRDALPPRVELPRQRGLTDSTRN